MPHTTALSISHIPMAPPSALARPGDEAFKNAPQRALVFPMAGRVMA